jgi:hypothetical protein
MLKDYYTFKRGHISVDQVLKLRGEGTVSMPPEINSVGHPNE